MIVKRIAFLYVVGEKRNVQKTFHKCRIYCWTGEPGFLSMKWTALNCKRHQTSLTERWKARVCIEDAVCLVPRVRPRSLCAWQIPYERQSNVQNYNRGMFDLSLSFVHSVDFVSLRARVWILPRSDDGCKRSSSRETACSYGKNE